jgi:predicted ribosome quality control (RQC) complex YloA/Tae2 family protein
LWFHIRGLGGSHVWVPRGQPLFGAKDSGLRDDLELWACQLAVYNSKARHSGTGVVDITEKRHLKSAKGQEGTLIIGRSQTRMADIDEAFEKWLKT